MQWQKQSSSNIFIGNLRFNTKIVDLYELFSLKLTTYLRETCKTNMPVNEKTGKCKGLVLEH